MKNMDIVIPYRKTQSEELRYCLRSLRNIPHRNVFICGDKPNFISDEVIYLPGELLGTTAQLDCELNIRLALQDKRLSDDFIYINDDFFVMKRVTELPNYQNGSFQDIINKRTDPMFRKHNQSLKSTKEYLNKFVSPMSFELHVPMIMNKANRLKISNEIMPYLLKGTALLPRSIYGNSFCDTNEYKKDVKVYNSNDKMPTGAFVSTLDRAFGGNVGDIIKNKFKTNSKYEI